MHLKAIAIKEQLLGADDYEVALSVGHLASLYNYDMQKYDEAEKLYLRSISIGIHSFMHSAYFFSTSSSPLLLGGATDYSIDTMSKLTRRSATGNCE